MLLKLVILGGCIAGAGWWVHGSDILSGALLVLLAGGVAAMFVMALARRRSRGERGGGGGDFPCGPDAGRPVPRPPGRPPSLAASARP